MFSRKKIIFILILPALYIYKMCAPKKISSQLKCALYYYYKNNNKINLKKKKRIKTESNIKKSFVPHSINLSITQTNSMQMRFKFLFLWGVGVWTGIKKSVQFQMYIGFDGDGGGMERGGDTVICIKLWVKIALFYLYLLLFS